MVGAEAEGGSAAVGGARSVSSGGGGSAWGGGTGVDSPSSRAMAASASSSTVKDVSTCLEAPPAWALGGGGAPALLEEALFDGALFDGVAARTVRVLDDEAAGARPPRLRPSRLR